MRRDGAKLTLALRAVRRAGSRLERHRLAAGLAVSAVAAVLAWIGWASTNGVPLEQRYELHALVPASAPIVKPGDAVRVAGRLAGIVTAVAPHAASREVTMELDPAYAPVGRDARVRVTVKSIVYLTYVSIVPGDTSDPLPPGGTIPLRQSRSGVDLLQVVRLFDRRTRRTLEASAVEAGLGLAGRGAELNSALHDLPPLERDATAELRAITARPGAIARTVAGADRVARGLAGQRPGDVSGLVRSGAASLGALARRPLALQRATAWLRPFEDAVRRTAPLADPVLAAAARLSRRLRAPLASLARALPELNRALGRGDELRRQTARLTGALRPVIAAAAPVLARLEPTVASINPLLRPLGRLVRTVRPYRRDFSRAGRWVVSASTKRFDEGQTAPGNPALRFMPVFTCEGGRTPYPPPGTTIHHRAPPC